MLRGFSRFTICSDSLTAISECRSTSKDGPLAHLGARFAGAIEGIEDKFEVSWVPGHVGIHGNEIADATARKEVISYIGDTDGTVSYMGARELCSIGRQTCWESCFTEKTHFYTREPSRKMKHLEDLNRDEFRLLLRLRTDKGWSYRYSPSSCPACRDPMSSLHINKFCGAVATNRPVGKSIHRDRDFPAFLA